MKNKLFNPLAIICSFLFVIAVVAVADLNGKWVGIILVPGGQQLNVSYTFKVDGDKLTGSASSPQGDVSIDNGKINGDQFSFSVNVDGTAYPHTGKLYTDSCGMDIDFGGAKSHFKITREK